LDLLCHLGAENLWFQELGYQDVFLLRLRTRLSLWVLVLTVSGLVLGGNLGLALKLRQAALDTPRAEQELWRGQLGFPGLLLSLIAIGFSLMVILVHYGEILVHNWQPWQANTTSLLDLPPALNLAAIYRCWELLAQPWKAVLILGLGLGIGAAPEFGLGAMALVLSLGLGFILSNQWAPVLASFAPSAFGQTDPLLDHDISFYVFTLPIAELLHFWWLGLVVYSCVGVLGLYLLSGNNLSQGRFPGFSPPQQRHLWGLSAGLLSVVASSYWLSRYHQLYSGRGVTYGASYTDVTVQLPVNTGLSVVAIVLGGICLWQAIQPRTRIPRRLLFCCLAGYGGLILVLGYGLPSLVQRLVVQPNELARETPYILRSIGASREAFGLNNIEVSTFDPEDRLTLEDLQRNQATIRNIRLWDSRPLLQTNRQLQQIRLYYSFPDADLDRYTLRGSQGMTELQQVLLAARELDYDAVPDVAQTWVNQHLVYTHGYGFTLSPVNRVGPGGLPEYFVKDIGADTVSTLDVANEAIRASIPIGHPRIYYGALTQNYIMTRTQVQELDYPSGNENVYNVYDGRGGMSLGAGWRRWLFAIYLRDWQMLLTQNFLPQTQLLFRRNIKERIEAIAPFLAYDPDAYLVIANPNLKLIDGEVVDTTSPNQTDTINYLYWMIDAYTTSSGYPYSDPGDNGFNYIRNSVKVVVDAYHGSVDFYVADPDDPLLKTWTRLFPNLFKPLEQMPIALKSHIRYPSKLFKVQSERLLTYHMTDPQVFYNREDQWQVPSEIYAGEVQPIESYYLITRLPTEESEEFILLNPFTPVSRNNLIAWLAGRSDGDNYGKLLLYQFPKQRLIFGPEQIEARVNQDPIISQQISLWNRQGSRAIQGNLLVIPIEQSLLYVEPIYLEAERNSLPTLARVIVVYENQIVMAETLQAAIDTLFNPDAAVTQEEEELEEITTLPIVRPLETDVP
jgi:uncharacterized membrane protein (UPF0182 family)